MTGSNVVTPYDLEVLSFSSSCPFSLLRCISVLQISSRISLEDANFPFSWYINAAKSTTATDTSGDHWPTWLMVSFADPSFRMYHSIQHMKATTSNGEMMMPASKVKMARRSMIRRRVAMKPWRSKVPLEVLGGRSCPWLGRRRCPTLLGKGSIALMNIQLLNMSVRICCPTLLLFRHRRCGSWIGTRMASLPSLSKETT